MGAKARAISVIAAAAALAFASSPRAPAQAPAVMFTSSGNSAFDAWRADFARRAIAAGRRPAVVQAVLDQIVPQAQIIEHDQNQAEFVRPVWDYVEGAVNSQRIAMGAQKRAQAGLIFAQVQAKYGVDADIIAGIWAMETNFGAAPLNYDAPSALATLAFDLRRRAQFEGYLAALIEMVERGYAGPAELKSSWAGAMGQPQFMPDVYLSAAVDWNGDGRRDIWSNDGDIIASIANYLAIKGWRRDQPIFQEATLPPGFNYALADQMDRPVTQWAALGVKRIDGAPWTPAEGMLSAQLYLPAGAQGPALLLYPNFQVIKKYNNSDRYALSVALLARGFEGRGGLTRPWPKDAGALRRGELVELQTLLMRVGYYAGAPDGMFGSQTRRGVALFQKASGMVPDGYPTPDLLTAIRTATGAAPSPRAKRDLTPLRRPQIAQLQKTLAQLGYKVRTTGDMTPGTRSAIQAEEKRLGLDPTGKPTAFILAATRERLSTR